MRDSLWEAALNSQTEAERAGRAFGSTRQVLEQGFGDNDDDDGDGDGEVGHDGEDSLWHRSCTMLARTSPGAFICCLA